MAVRKRHYWTDASLARLRALLVDSGQTQTEAAKTMGLSVNQIQRGAAKLGLSRPQRGALAQAAGEKAGDLAPLPFAPPTPPLGQRCAHVTVTGAAVERCSSPCAEHSPWCREHAALFHAKRPDRRKEDAA